MENAGRIPGKVLQNPHLGNANKEIKLTKQKAGRKKRSVDFPDPQCLATPGRGLIRRRWWWNRLVALLQC